MTNLEEWKLLNIEGISNIEECVGEFKITIHNKLPNPHFMVKVYKGKSDKYTGYTNIRVRDDMGFYECGVGNGNTIAEALESTLKYFNDMLSTIDNTEDDYFQYAKYDEF